jgi:hypothetical protein
MAHGRLEFTMPASEAVAFDAFHFHQWRAQWDSLVGSSRVIDGAPCPYVGALTENAGRGWLRALAMRTRFVSFDRPRLAAATMMGRSFPFETWAASMRHLPNGNDASLLIYTYTFTTWPTSLRWLMEPLVDRIFARQTRRRFTRMRKFLTHHASALEHWQRNAPSQEPRSPRVTTE